MAVDLQFTGEYVVPGKTPYIMYEEHTSRYVFAGAFVKDKIVLDIACGTGYGAYYLLGKGAKYLVGIDISSGVIDYATRKYAGVRKLCFARADAISLPFPDTCADIIVSFETIEHLEDQARFLSECKRLLKSDGLFICSTPNKKISSPYSEKPINPFHVKEFYPAEFSDLLCRQFSSVNLYGQCDVNLIIWKLVRVRSKALSVLPGREIVRGLLRKIIPVSYSFNKNPGPTAPEISEEAVDKSYKVHKFRGSLIQTPKYVIAVAEK